MNAKIAVSAVLGLMVLAWGFPARAAEPAPTNAAKEELNRDQAKAGPVTDVDKLTYDEDKVSAEMLELEDRMYRLSETLKDLEPENAGRLQMGLKMARDELILQVIAEAKEALKRAALDDAVQEQKQVIAKLERLRDLLLSTDLDLLMKIERLKLMRGVIRKLKKSLKEENREHAQTHELAFSKRPSDEAAKDLATVGELIRRQTEHLEGTRALTGAAPAGAPKQNAGELSMRQGQTRDAAASIGGKPGTPAQAAAALAAARKGMEGGIAALDGGKPKDAVAPMQKALDELKTAEGRWAKLLSKQPNEAPKDRLQALRKAQEGNRKDTDSTSELIKKLGESGAKALPETLRASGRMGKAEQQLARSRPDMAGEDQKKAIDSLQFALDELESEEEQLLGEIHTEIRKQVIEALVQMLERQGSVRQTSEALAPRMKPNDRDSLTTASRLAESEGRIIKIDDDILKIVRETEFGIALPAALEAVHVPMEKVQDWLGKGKVDRPVIALERDIESDLAALLKAMKQLPPGPQRDTPPRKGSRIDRIRELNRLTAELRMLRVLQNRINVETASVDKTKPPKAAAPLPGAIKEQIEVVKDRQDDVRQTTDRLAPRLNEQ